MFVKRPSTATGAVNRFLMCGKSTCPSNVAKKPNGGMLGSSSNGSPARINPLPPYGAYGGGGGSADGGGGADGISGCGSVVTVARAGTGTGAGGSCWAKHGAAIAQVMKRTADSEYVLTVIPASSIPL